jgi:hypothetical protein
MNVYIDDVMVKYIPFQNHLLELEKTLKKYEAIWFKDESS